RRIRHSPQHPPIFPQHVFDTSKTDKTLRNVFAKKQSWATAPEESGATKEEQAIELLKGMTPEQIMAVISAINR
ncbi:MAG TPA: hypothetical protein DEG90_08690, partial [Porphyromonadaceae bacterium]|nr:hypothetical protein [Porphyromonadaceae bacterium]